MPGETEETSRPKRKYFYGRTRKEVQEKINEVALKVQAGTYREPSKLTVAEWFTTWLNDYMKLSLRLLRGRAIVTRWKGI